MVLRLVIVGVMHVVAVAGALTYCSSQNTGSTSAQSYQYQSNGWCSLECKGYDYAIVQGYDCWCSDDAPGASTAVSHCDEPCPGYSYEACGSADAALFGYIYLGTGAASSLPSESASSASSASSSSSSAASSSSSASSAGAAASSTSVSLWTAASSPASSSLWASSAASSAASSSGPSSSAASASPAPASSSSPSSAPSSSASPASSAFSSAAAASASSSTASPTPSSTSSSTPSSTSSATPSSTSTPAPSSTTSSSTTSASSSSSTSSTPSPTTSSAPSSTTAASPSTTTASPSTRPATSSYSISDQLVTSVIYSVQTVTAAPSNSAATAQAFTTQVVTTVFSTPTSVPAVGSARSSHTSFWHSPGKVAGTFVAVGVVVLALVVLAVFFFMRRRRSRDEDFERRYNDVVAPVASASSLDTRSSSSPNGFVYADEKGIQGHPTPSQKNDASRVSQLTEDDSSVLQQPDAPVVVDQRLDPRQMIMTQWENGGSRLSLADDVDYSRKVLRVINE